MKNEENTVLDTEPGILTKQKKVWIDITTPYIMSNHLLEFFSAFNVIDDEQYKQRESTHGLIKNTLGNINHSDNPDDNASKWGLSDNLNPFLTEILVYQTRHYNHE